MKDKVYAELQTKLEETRKEMAYYKRLSKESGNLRLRETEGLSRLITKLKQTEEKLRESEAKYRSLFENAIEGIFQATPEGRFISANPAQANLFGYESPRELMEQVTDIAKQHYVNPKDRETYKNTLEAKGIVKGFEVQLLKKDRNPVWVSLNTHVVRDEEGVVIYYEGTVEDITEHKEAEEEREGLILKLEKALSEVNKLSGLLPICASCKKIRNDKGYWEQMETYIRDRSEAEFTHGICPECTEKLYPEYYKNK